jgi:hypothetical protein
VNYCSFTLAFSMSLLLPLKASNQYKKESILVIYHHQKMSSAIYLPLYLFLGLVILATSALADYYKPPSYEHKPHVPIYKPPTFHKPPPHGHRPPVENADLPKIPPIRFPGRPRLPPLPPLPRPRLRPHPSPPPPRAE